jgi:hypothetical protein
MAEVRERGAVVEVDQRVHDRLGMHHYLDALVRHSEQVMGLDHLEPLVHQGRGIDRDPPPHVPRRVRQRLFRADLAEIGPAPERPAGRRQHETVDCPWRRSGEELLERGVLGIHGQDSRSARLG